MHASPNDSARVPLHRTIMTVSTPPPFLVTRFHTPRDSFDLPPRPPISKRITAGRIVVDMSPLIEEENSSGINRGYKSRGTNTEWRRSRVIGMMLLLARGRCTRGILCCVIGRCAMSLGCLVKECQNLASCFLNGFQKFALIFIATVLIAISSYISSYIESCLYNSILK